MRYFPIWLDIQDKPCLLVGGGEVAARKASALLKAGAALTVVAPALSANMQDFVNGRRIRHIRRQFEPRDVCDRVLVVAATDIDEVNASVHRAARAHGVLCNVVDSPDLCDYVNGAMIERNPITIAISSGGDAPVLARGIKAKLETLIPSAYGELGKLIGAYRERVKATIPFGERRYFWEKVLNGPVAEAALSGQRETAQQLLEQAIARGGDTSRQGELYLIGAGPGDPDLLTFKALRLLQKADVVVHDRLIAEPIMNLCRQEAERIYVGKLANDHSVPQEEISQILVDLAKKGKTVARLKGGDALIFGRGGEEISLLAEHAVPFQIVPAVTSAAGCAAYSGIPLTHRDYAQACVFVTGHTKNDELDHLNWSQLAQPFQTVVFYMGLKNIEAICRHLLDAGAPASRSAALIEQGTTTSQRVMTGTLATLPSIVRQSHAKPPSLIIVGEVVQLHGRLNWYNGRETEDTAFPFRHKMDD